VGGPVNGWAVVERGGGGGGQPTLPGGSFIPPGIVERLSAQPGSGWAGRYKG
jgi:hypothetical protein